ncbi:MAG: OmpA family protein [Methylococcaceae bacterium]|nr:OmpA family protein [Methylococcaceae bacterium]
MNKILIMTIASVGAFLSGCATQPISTFQSFAAQDLNGLIASGQYEQKTNNFFVINDSSSSMSEDYLGAGYPADTPPIKFSVEKEILSRINQTIPDITLTSSIRSFGFGPCLSWGFTKLNQAPTPYSKSSFGSGIDALTCASGGSPISSGIDGTNSDLSATSSDIAVLILSDGYGLDSNGFPALTSLKQTYGDRLCVYTIWVGNEKDSEGQNVLRHLSDKAGCGFSTTAEAIASPDSMAYFVKSVFLKQAPPKCSVLDSDSDGINDCDDKCPDTLKGAHVNPFGCWIVDVKFDNDKSNIKPEYYNELDNAVAVINANPGFRIEVQGHTSNTGSADYNQRLSERRAHAVKSYLAQHANEKEQAEHNLTAKGYGLTQPIDTNETEAGRANNRRVELKVIK